MRKLGKIPRRLRVATLAAGFSIFFASPLGHTSEYSYTGYDSGAQLKSAGSYWFVDLLSISGQSGLFNFHNTQENVWTVNYKANKAPDFVIGGVPEDDDNSNPVKDNRIDYYGGTSSAASLLVGGLSYAGEVLGTTVNVIDSNAATVFGGLSYGGAATNNIVTITNSTINAGDSGSGTGGEDEDEGGSNVSIIWSMQSNDDSDWTVTIPIIVVSPVVDSSSSVFGGYSYSGATGNNTVSVTGGEITGNIFGGYSYSGTVNDNKDDNDGDDNVNLTAGEVGDGGWVIPIPIEPIVPGDNDNDNDSANSTVTNNTVSITGGKITGNVFGGYSYSGTTTTNTVTLAGAITFGNSSIQGGDGEGNVEHFAGNILNLNELNQSGTISTVQNFNYYNFTVDAANANKNGTFVLTAATVNMTQDAEVRSVAVVNGALSAGDTVGLLKATDQSSDLDSAYEYDNGGQELLEQTSGLFTYDFLIKESEDGKELYATVMGNKANPANRSLSAGYLAGADFLNRGADLIEKAAMKDAGDKTCQEYGPAVFAASEYLDYRCGDSSRAGVKGHVLAFGLSTAAQNRKGTRVLTGAFLEAGWGDYGGQNNFGGASDAKGEGNIGYRGLGFLARRDNARRGAGHLYTESSLRVGRVRTGFSGYLGSPGTNAYYNARAPYYGLHIGAGYIRELRGGADIDLYGKLLYTHTGGDAVSILGSEVKFDAANSLRTRAGLRYNKTVGEKNGFYLGLAYEYEFSGKQQAYAAGLPIAAPDIKGGTGIGEIGIVLKGKRSQIDLKAEGYTGKRQGFGLSADIKWFF